MALELFFLGERFNFPIFYGMNIQIHGSKTSHVFVCKK